MRPRYTTRALVLLWVAGSLVFTPLLLLGPLYFWYRRRLKAEGAELPIVMSQIVAGDGMAVMGGLLPPVLALVFWLVGSWTLMDVLWCLSVSAGIALLFWGWTVLLSFKAAKLVCRDHLAGRSIPGPALREMVRDNYRWRRPIYRRVCRQYGLDPEEVIHRMCQPVAWLPPSH